MPIGNRFKVASVRGIPIYVASSWLWVAALYSFLVYTSFTNSIWRPTPVGAAGLTLFEGVLFFGGVLLHESAHAIAARAFGLPVTGITLVFWGGATETRANAKGPLAEFVVSAVGPLTTLVLAGIFAAVAMAMGPGLMREIVRQLAGLNVLIGVINLLPGFPLDGGRMLQAATWGDPRPPDGGQGRGIRSHRGRGLHDRRRRLELLERHRPVVVPGVHRVRDDLHGARHGPTPSPPRSPVGGDRRGRDATHARPDPRHDQPVGGARRLVAREPRAFVPGRGRRPGDRNGVDGVGTEGGLTRSAPSGPRRDGAVVADAGRGSDGILSTTS